jgi:hypothetical protein
MSKKSIAAECNNCESTYSIDYIEQIVSSEYPEFCPFCGEMIEEISEEYIEDEYDSDDDDKWN